MLSYIMTWFTPRVVRDDTTQKITELLFPPIEEVTMDGYTFLTDYSVDSNLYSVMVDLEDGINDLAGRETLKKCHEKLQEVRRLLMADKTVPISKAKYLVVDNPN